MCSAGLCAGIGAFAIGKGPGRNRSPLIFSKAWPPRYREGTALSTGETKPASVANGSLTSDGWTEVAAGTAVGLLLGALAYRLKGRSFIGWTAIGSNAWLGLPIIIWIVLALFLFNHILLSRTTFGRRTYLTGGNREAAVYSGIKVDRLKITIFTLSGVMAAISGILLSSRLYSAQTNAGMSYELDAIAAVVIGGTSLAGGVGRVTGTVIVGAGALDGPRESSSPWTT